MKQDLLREVLSRIGDHPDRISEFRKVVIALAISDKLKPEGGGLSSSDILAAVEARKAKLCAAKQISKPKLYSAVTEEDLPEQFCDPSGFVALGTIARIEKGLTGIKQAVAGDFPLVVTAAERGTCNHFDFEGAAAIIPLVSSTGHGNASINRLHYQEGQFALGTILAAVFPFAPDLVSARFIFEYLSTFKDELLVSRMTGTANVTLSIGKIAEVPVPLICPSVQRKIDELMALCDQLEAARESREAERDKLTAASFARLNALDPETFPADARFALANLASLTTRADQIKALRQSILNLATRGALMTQDTEDEPAPELLGRIKVENQKLMLEKGIRAQKPGLPADDFEELVKLPSSWQRVYLQDIAYQITDGTHLTPRYTETGKPFLSAQNVKPFRFMPENHRFVSAVDFDKYRANRRPERGDVLMTRVGAGIGEAAVLDSDFEFAFYVSLCLIKIPNQLVSADYIALWLNGPEGRASSTTRTYGKGASQGNLNLSLIRTFNIPLPPLAEQHRIVAKVDELMALCDRLEASLTEEEQIRSHLLQSVLQGVLEPA
tara:strand:- start:133 stop:1794 length:1662 start_codon:yes stop_codon:yes gene_type:complete